MDGGLDAGAVFPIAAGVDIWRKRGWGLGGEAGRLGGNGVGNDKGVQVGEGRSRERKNRADFGGGFGGELVWREALEIQNGSGDEMKSRRSKFGSDIGDLDEMADAASGSLGKNQAGSVVEGGLALEINHRHAARRWRRW